MYGGGQSYPYGYGYAGGSEGAAAAGQLQLGQPAAGAVDSAAAADPYAAYWAAYYGKQ